MFAGGIGMFLYGMNLMADGMQKSAGGRMQKLLGLLTGNRLAAILVGALVTALIQSSGATTVMVVGFVNAGILTLTQAVGVIMGANIGTTITSWIVSMGQFGDAVKVLAPSFYAPLLIGLGAIVALFGKKDRTKLIGEIIIGIGLLFMGLDFMSGSISPYTDSPIFSEIFRLFGSNPLLGVLAGVLVTALLQSSSASVGILQTLAMNGVVTTNAAIYITLGQNIGSCVTALLSSVGTNRTAKRAAAIHLTFNAIGAILFGTAGFILFLIKPELAAHNISSVEISLFHTFFNLTCTTVMAPFAGALVKFSNFIVPGDKQVGEEAPQQISHIDDRILESPSFAVETGLKEVLNMGRISYDNICNAMDSVINDDMELVESVFEKEKQVDELEKTLTGYLAKVNNLALNEKQHLLVNNLFHAIIDVERVSDHAENLAELAQYKIENGIVFSDEGVSELKEICDMVKESFRTALEAREKGTMSLVRKVTNLEDEVDSLEEELRDKHIQRLSSGLCTPSKGVVYLDILSNVERVSDHANNIVTCVMDEL
jgi:phosphate:Na+ symporter